MSHSEQEEQKVGQASFRVWVQRDSFLSVVVTILSMLTAIVGYQAAMTNSRAGRIALQAQRVLNEANGELTDAGQIQVMDFNAFVAYQQDGGATGERVGMYEALFSDFLMASLAEGNNENPFTEKYEDELLATAWVCLADSDELFALGGDVRTLAERYQLVLFVYALGLAFAAWASLAKGRERLRFNFIMLALLFLLVGLVVYGQVWWQGLGTDTNFVSECLATLLGE
ncbi:MAG TPA: hypothetical protein VLL52_04485 [Anaerolineae bacterium]|nr:hypothetical protein [Anaerolineae bacterium]